MGNSWSAVIKPAIDYCKNNPEIVFAYGKMVYDCGENLWNLAKDAFSKAAPQPAPMPTEMSPENITADRKAARTNLGINTEDDFNVAFCGQVKGGKSRMINAIRGIKKGEPNWAEVGNLRTTNRISPYRFTDGTNQHLVLWDCPGAGQLEDNGAGVKTYFKDNKLYAFDCLLIFLNEMVRAEDLEYAKQAFRYGVPFAFVRSKSDMSIGERVRDVGESIEVARNGFLLENRDAFAKALKFGGDAIASAPLFFVSAIIIEKQKQKQPIEYELEEGLLTLFVLNKTLSRRGCIP